MELIRTCRFNIRKIWFTLKVWDTFKMREFHSVLKYRLSRSENGTQTVLFEGEDFYASPAHAIDSDATMASLLGFLCLRPGDTDREYFDRYTPRQMEFAETEADQLNWKVYCRFEN